MPHASYPDLGMVAYTAYGLQTRGRTHDGRQMPNWDDLGDSVQDAWKAAAQAVITADRTADHADSVELPEPVLVDGAPQAPSLGGIVLVPMDPATNNGSNTAPAVITRVWSDTMINAQVLLDGYGTTWRTSVGYVDDLSTIDDDDPARLRSWSWPPRT